MKTKVMKYRNILMLIGLVACICVYTFFTPGNNNKNENLINKNKNIKDRNEDYYVRKINALENNIHKLEQQLDKQYDNTEKSEEDNDCEKVHVAIVCGGYNASREVSILIKSILFYRRCPLHVHFIVDYTSKSILSNLFRTWNIPHFQISFYLSDKLKEAVLWVPTTHYSGIFGLMKLVLLNTLPKDVKKIIVLDTDLIFLYDIKILWNYFTRFNSTQAIGVVENQSDWYLGKLYKNYKPWPAYGKGYNTGIMLLDCSKLLDMSWNSIWESIAKKYLEEYISTSLADQDIINAVIKDMPNLLFELPCNWNIQLSTFSKADLCYNGHIYDVKVVHWNSPAKQAVVNHHGEYFKNIYESFVEYDGNLLKLPVSHCASNYEIEVLNIENSDVDYCKHMLTKSLRLHRTHIYFLPFTYTPKTLYDVTLTLQLSIDRLLSLQSIAIYWKGPISVAVFLRDTDVRKLLYFIEHSKILSQRHDIAYHLVYRNYDEAVYPVNFLRNVAIKYAITTYVFTCDIDFIPSSGLYDYLIHSVLPLQDSDSKYAYIIPAFENLQYKIKVPETKSELIETWEKNVIIPFRYQEWPQGHNITDYIKWKNSNELYKVEWVNDYEPYVVVRKDSSPKYDRRFVGFGWNKVSFTMELSKAGFKFMVVPYGFILHMPHAPSMDIAQYRSSSKYRKCLRSLKETFIKEIDLKYKN